VINVSWNDAKAYVEWLAEKTGKRYRLLSEAEWEYAARAGSTTAFWWGDSISTNEANYDGRFTYPKCNSSFLSGLFAAKRTKGEFRHCTVPVNEFDPNTWGLYQVHGNVAEWTEDCYDDSYRGKPTDGSAFTTGACSRRVVRGGSWHGDPEELRSATRMRAIPSRRIPNLGFRVGVTL
jgi:formylglycine-generating enzyme required for sulfatase activity